MFPPAGGGEWGALAGQVLRVLVSAAQQTQLGLHLLGAHSWSYFTALQVKNRSYRFGKMENPYCGTLLGWSQRSSVISGPAKYGWGN